MLRYQCIYNHTHFWCSVRNLGGGMEYCTRNTFYQGIFQCSTNPNCCMTACKPIKYFLCLYTAHPLPSMTLSSFSHVSFLHVCVNMYVLWSFASVTVNLMGPEQFAAFYISAGKCQLIVTLPVYIFLFICCSRCQYLCFLLVMFCIHNVIKIQLNKYNIKILTYRN